MWRFERRTFDIGLLKGQTQFGMSKRYQNGFDPQGTETGCSSFKVKHYHQACTTSGKKTMILYAK